MQYFRCGVCKTLLQPDTCPAFWLNLFSPAVYTFACGICSSEWLTNSIAVIDCDYWLAVFFAVVKNQWTRMWTSAQRDGRPAEYRWRPLFNAAKIGWRPLECRAVTRPRRETRWNLQGCPKLPNRPQPLVGRSSPYCEDIWDILLFNNFSRLSRRALVVKI